LTTHQLDLQHQLTQELTIAHQQPRLNWVGGVFLFNEADHQTYWVDQSAARIQVQLDPRVDATSRAAFGQATVGLTPRLSATAGIRYTHEGKDIDNAGGRYRTDAPYAPVAGSVYSYSDSIAHDAWTPRVGIEIKLPHDALAYVSATRGFKSGGFNPSSTAPGRGYAPEWAWSYEGGWKGTLIDGRSRFAATPRSTTASSDRLRMPFSAPASNTVPASVGGLSPPTRETSPTRITSRRRSGPPPRPLADVLVLHASSRSISRSGDKISRCSSTALSATARDRRAGEKEAADPKSGPPARFERRANLQNDVDFQQARSSSQ
jgi:TonB dependent receptor